MPAMIHKLFAAGAANGWPNRTRALTRRLLLKASAAAALAAAMPSRARAQTPPRRVAIVGGGFGGLACADGLLEAGVDVNVFEAESRVGGRVLTDRKLIDGAPVELGGEFIGSNHPTWFRLAQKHNVELDELPEVDGDEAFILEGRLLKGERLKRLHDEVDQMTEKLVEMAAGIDPVRPFDAANAAELDGQSLLEWISAAPVSDPARAMMIAYEEADNGVPAGRMSLLAYLAVVAGGGLGDYYELSETHRARGGNDALATAIARSLGDRVKLRTPIVRIDRTQPAARLLTGEGVTLEADVVVLAVPPTAWEHIEFDPPLPRRLRPQFGANCKLIVKVERPFWPQTGLSPEIYGDGLVQVGWVSAEGGDGASYTMFNGADQAAALRSLPPQDRTERACESLAPAFPGLSGLVKKDLFVDWPGMPRVRGSYSFPAPGQVVRFGPTLLDGLDDGAPLRFVGEHTSYAFIGYMEGALSSGARVAAELRGR